MALALDKPLPPTVLRGAPRAPQPPGMLLPLKDHQLAMLHRCMAIEKGAIMSPYKMGFMADPVAAGKCFARGTRVLLSTGEAKAVEEVVVGDMLMGDDSTPREVLALGRGRDELFEISSDDGTSYTVNSEHILCLRADPRAVEGAAVPGPEPDGVFCPTVRQLLALPAQQRAHFRGYRRAVRFPAQPVPQDPYAAGQATAVSGASGGGGLPAAFTRNTEAVRLAYLAGLLDRWALWGSARYTFIGLTGRNAADIVALARGLGFRAAADAWGVTVGGPGLHELPMATSIKRAPGGAARQAVQTYPLAVTPKGPGEYFGFHIGGNRRFLLPDFSVTHNTAVTVGMQMADKGSFGRKSLNFIIVPQNICMQWREEIARFSGDALTVMLLTNYASLSELSFGPQAINKYDTILTTPAYFTPLAEFCEQCQVAPRRIVVDEADTVCNMINKKIPGVMTWFLSATMDRLPETKGGMVQIGKHTACFEDFNAPADGQACLRTKGGGVLRAEEAGTYEIPARLLRSGERVCRCEPDWIAESFGIPAPTSQTVVCSNIIIDIIACLTFAKLLQPKQLESANARDFRNLRTGSDDEFEIIPALVKRYTVRKVDAEMSLGTLKGGMHMEQRIEECKAEVDRCTAYLASIRDQLARSLLCQATFEQLALPDRKLPPVDRCHVCPACYAGYCCTWVAANPGAACLRCGAAGPFQERVPAEPAKVDNKVKRLAEIVRGLAADKDSPPRIIVFAKYTQAFSTLRRELSDLELKIQEADAGTAEAAHKMLTAFKEGAIDVLLAESGLFCSGMNLPEVTDVCFLHAIHPYSVAQIAGRAQRPGRKAPCRLWTFLHDNELPVRPPK